MTSQAFKQTSRLFAFSLKKEWVKLLLWVVGCLLFVFIGIFAFVEIYFDPAEREAMAMAMSNPAMEAIFGRMIGTDNYTIGAMYSHMMTIMTLVLFSIQSILLVVRNTRAEEEEGLVEMLQALPTGRLAHTASTLLLLFLVNGVAGIGSTVVLLAFGDASITVEGAVLTGIIYGLIGLIFGTLTLVMAQLSSSARGTLTLSFGLLGLAYILRIIGDGGVEALSWVSPLGLLYGTEPFVSNNWWPVFVGVGITLVLVILSLYLKQKRDLGSGLLPDRAGKDKASAFLKTPFGFAFRLFRTPFIVWTVSLILLGVTYGSVIGDVEAIIQGNEIVEQVLGADPATNMSEQFMVVIIGVLSLAATIPVVQSFIRIKREEKKNRLEHVLAGTRSRWRVLGSFLLLSFLTSFWMQIMQMAAFAGGAVAMDFDIPFSDPLIAGLSYLPAIWVVCGLAVLVIGWAPKITAFVWLYLGFAFFVLYFGELFNLPDWLRLLSAYEAVPEYPIENVNWGTSLILTLIAVGMTSLGVIGFKRRDID